MWLGNTSTAVPIEGVFQMRTMHPAPATHAFHPEVPLSPAGPANAPLPVMIPSGVHPATPADHAASFRDEIMRFIAGQAALATPAPIPIVLLVAGQPTTTAFAAVPIMLRQAV